MQVGIVGLGRMGMNMARRLLRKGHEVVAYNRSPQRTEEIAQEGAIGAFSLADLTDRLTPPRVVWMMLPAGSTVEESIRSLLDLLSSGDILVDGGNTHYRDDLRRATLLASKGIRFVDAGVSGGIRGLDFGYCLMVGGERDAFLHLEPILQALSAPGGYLHCGKIGAGHFVKMVHNGIEYAMMQAYGEGFALLNASPYRESMDHGRIAHLWNQGSVIRSWLLELLEGAFEKNPELSEIRGYVEDTGEGRWTVEEAIEKGVPVPAIAAALFQRFRSREEESFSDRVVAALRREFGGHPVKG